MTIEEANRLSVMRQIDKFISELECLKDVYVLMNLSTTSAWKKNKKILKTFSIKGDILTLP